MIQVDHNRLEESVNGVFRRRGVPGIRGTQVVVGANTFVISRAIVRPGREGTGTATLPIRALASAARAPVVRSAFLGGPRYSCHGIPFRPDAVPVGHSA
ncbi:MAG: hypothetical protein ABI298_03620 [Acidimicrobiales bacterium]